MADGSVDVRPIPTVDVPQVAEFLSEHLNRRVSHAAWRRLMEPSWNCIQPNHGFQLVRGSTIVGAYIALYSRREIAGIERQFCNLAAFCVLPEFRAHGLRLYRALLGQRGFEFTDLSPSGNVVALNERMGFRRLDTSVFLVPSYPYPPSRSIRISEDLQLIRGMLTGSDRDIFDDHSEAPAARHILVRRAGGPHAYMMYRRDRRKRLPVFATPLYVGGDRQLLASAWRAVAARMLIRHGIVAMLADVRIVGFVPPGGYRMKTVRPRMFRSKILDASDVDYLYSELTMLEW